MSDWNPELAEQRYAEKMAGAGATVGDSSKWDGALAESRYDAAVKARISASVRQAKELNASNVARANGLARLEGVPSEHVYYNLPEYEARDLEDRFWSAPYNVRAFLSDPSNAALAKDDVGLLSQMEDTWGSVFKKQTANIGAGFLNTAGSALTVGAKILQSGGNALMGQSSLAIIDAQLKALEAQKNDPSIDVNAEVLKNLADDPMLKKGKALAEEAKGIQKANAVNVPEWGAKDLVGSTYAGLGNMVPAIAAGMLGGPGAGASVLFGQVFSDKAAERLEKSDGVSAALTHGAAYALFEAIPEKMALEVIMKPGGKLLPKLFKGYLSEAAQEGLTGILQRGYDAGILDEKMTWGEAVNGVLKDAVVGGFVGSTISGAHHGLSKLVKQDEDAALAGRAEETLNRLKGLVDQTNVAKSDPQALRELIQKIAGEDNKLYLPADQVQALYQSGAIDDFALTDWGVADQLPEAIARDGDVVVDADKLLTGRSTPEQLNQIIGHIRTDPAGMTPTEAKQFLETRHETVQALMESIATQYDTKEPGQFVFDDVFRQLMTTGKHTAVEARALALKWQHRYQTRAKELGGIDPDQIYVEDNVTLAGPQMAQQSQQALRDNLDVVIARLKSGNEVKTPKTPILDLLKDKGGVAPVSELASELKARGITPKTHPGLYRKGGLQSVDTIVRSEHPILMDNAIAEDGNGYVDPNAILEAIGQEIAGKPLQTADDAARIAMLDEPVKQLAELMDRMGFDYKTATHEDIRAWIDQTEKEIASVGDRVAAALDGSGPAVGDSVALPPGEIVLNQVHGMDDWVAKTTEWMKAEGYEQDEIDRHIAAIEGQLKIFRALGPVQIEMFPHGAGQAKHRVKDGVPLEGPMRSNDDPIYRITFDASAMCVKRLESAATMAYIQNKLNRAMTMPERIALTALFRAAGKEAPCLYCYVEAPRGKQGDFIKNAMDALFGDRKPPKPKFNKAGEQDRISLAYEAAKAEIERTGITPDQIDVNILMDPKSSVSPAAVAKREANPDLYKYLEASGLAAKANLVKAYEEYTGQILDLPQDLLDELSGFAGLRFFSSSDFQASHVVDLMQAFNDMTVRKAHAHSYTKVVAFAEIFGKTGMKINTSIFAKIDERTGEITADTYQGMDWDDARRMRESTSDVGTILVATDDRIVEWGLKQPWIDYIIPYHHSGLAVAYSSSEQWQDFSSTQSEGWLNKDDPRNWEFAANKEDKGKLDKKGKPAKPKAAKIRMYEVGTKDGIADIDGTRGYLEAAMKRGLTPVFPAFLFTDYVAPKPTGNRKKDNDIRNKATKAALARWAEMVKSGVIDYSQINPNYFRLRKDYARTDTPFNSVRAYDEKGASLIDMARVEQAINEDVLSGKEASRTMPDIQLGDHLVAEIQRRDAENVSSNIGVDALASNAQGLVPFSQEGWYTHEFLLQAAVKLGMSETEAKAVLTLFEDIRFGRIEAEDGQTYTDAIGNIVKTADGIKLLDSASRGEGAATGDAATGAGPGAVGRSKGSGKKDAASVIAALKQNGDTVKGSYVRSRDPYGNISNFIIFTQFADRTTFIHESGHFFLFQAITDAFDSRATAEAQVKMKARIQNVLDWMGVKIDVSKVTNADEILSQITTEHHEQFARAYEAYFMEGRAPSVGLRDAFVQFGSWLVSLYKKLRNIPGYSKKLNPEVRDFIDHLLATDEAIEEARNASTYKMPAEFAAVLTEQERKNMEALLERAGIQARADLQGRIAKEMKREKTEWWKAERAKVEEEVTEEVRNRPVFRALNLLRSSEYPDGSKNIDADTGEVIPMKLDRDALIYEYGEEIIKMLPPGIVSRKGQAGIKHRIFASMAGFQSAEDLKQALMNAGDQASIIKYETDAKMAERHGSVMANLESEAADVVANDRQLELIALQAKYLRRLAGEAMAKTAKKGVIQEGAKSAATDRENMDQATTDALKVENAGVDAEGAATAQIAELASQVTAQVSPEQRTAQQAGAARTREMLDAINLDAIKEAARQLIRTKMVRDVTPDRFRIAADRLAKKIEIAIAKRDYAAAATMKEQQLLNLYMAREAKWGQSFVEKAVKKFTRINKNDAALARGADIDFMKAARFVLAKFGLAKADPQFDLNKWLDLVGEVEPAARQDFNDMINDLTANAKLYKDMTLDDFISLKQAVDAMMKMGRDARSVELNGERMKMSDIVNEMEQQIGGRLKLPVDDRTPTEGERRLMGFLGLKALVTRVETWARGLDDGKHEGAFTRLMVRPVLESIYTYRESKAATMQKLRDILLPAREDWNKPREIKARELGFTFQSKGELIHAILHTGNDSNMKKLIVGYKWGAEDRNGGFDRSAWDQFFSRITQDGTITKADMDMVQAIWDLLESTKGPAQQAHRKMFGYYFNEIPARPVATPFGVYRGGYVPAITDKLAVSEGGMRLDADALAQQQNAAMFPGSDRGFTKARVDYNKPLALDLMSLPSHLDKVLKFTHIGPVVREVARLAKNRGFNDLMSQYDKSAVPDLLIPWLQRSVNQTADTPSTGWGGRMGDSIARVIRTHTGLQMMVANIINALQQVTGISTAAVRVPPSYLARAMISSRNDPARTLAGIMEKSAFMRTRADSQMNDALMDVNDILAESTAMEKARNFTKRHGYFAQTIMQNVIDRVVWLGAYDHAVAQGMAEKQAVENADSVVRTSQGSFSPEDMTRIETGSAFVRIFTQFANYFVGQANLIGSEMDVTIRQLGWNGAKGKLFYLYMVGVFLPAVVAEAISQAARGDLGDEDDDGLLDDMLVLFGLSQIKYLLAMVPGVGQAGNYVISLMNNKPYDDRMSVAPALSAVEKAGKAVVDVPKAMFFGGDKSKAVSEFMTALGLVTGIPTGFLAKPISYAVDVAEGDSRPKHPGNVISGILTGRDGTAAH